MLVNEYSDLNISNSTVNTQSTSPLKDNISLFNSLLSNNTNEEVKPNTEKIKEAITEFNKRKENVSITSDTTNTHDELTLILELKNLQAS